jgi:heme A synthase
LRSQRADERQALFVDALVAVVVRVQQFVGFVAVGFAQKVLVQVLHVGVFLRAVQLSMRSFS